MVKVLRRHPNGREAQAVREAITAYKTESYKSFEKLSQEIAVKTKSNGISPAHLGNFVNGTYGLSPKFLHMLKEFLKSEGKRVAA